MIATIQITLLILGISLAPSILDNLETSNYAPVQNSGITNSSTGIHSTAMTSGLVKSPSVSASGLVERETSDSKAVEYIVNNKPKEKPIVPTVEKIINTNVNDKPIVLETEQTTKIVINEQVSKKIEEEKEEEELKHQPQHDEKKVIEKNLIEKKMIRELLKISTNQSIDACRMILELIESTFVEVRNKTFKQPVFIINDPQARLTWFVQYVTNAVYTRVSTDENRPFDNSKIADDILLKAQRRIDKKGRWEKAGGMQFTDMFVEGLLITKVVIPYIQYLIDPDSKTWEDKEAGRSISTVVRAEMVNRQDNKSKKSENPESENPKENKHKKSVKSSIIKALFNVSPNVQIVDVGRDIIENIESTIIELKNKAFKQPIFVDNTQAKLNWFIKYITAKIYNKLMKTEDISAHDIVEEAKKEAKVPFFTILFNEEDFINRVVVLYIKYLIN